MPDTRLAIIGADPLFAAALENVLAERFAPSTMCCAEYETTPDARSRTSGPAELVVIDVDGVTNPRAVVEALRRASPEVRLIALCDDVAGSVVRLAIDLRLDGLVCKNDDPAALLAAAGHVIEGRAVMPAGWQRAAWGHPASPEELEGRQREIVALAASGLSNREIATRLVLSPNTVKSHIRAAYARLGVRRRVELVHGDLSA